MPGSEIPLEDPPVRSLGPIDQNSIYLHPDGSTLERIVLRAEKSKGSKRRLFILRLYRDSCCGFLASLKTYRMTTISGEILESLRGLFSVTTNMSAFASKASTGGEKTG